MNFVGHAAVAGWTASDPEWVLGAMLPDFASMARARLAGAEAPRVAAGIGHHHATDEAFHAAPTFVSLNEGGTRAMEQAGVSRGPARAVAHVGTELLIDGLLLEREAVRRAYLGAIALDGRALGLRFRGEEGGARFHTLHGRLRDHGLPDTYRTVDGVLERLGQALGRRPRLAWAPAERPAIRAWLVGTRDALEGALPRLLDEVRAGLVEPPLG